MIRKFMGAAAVGSLFVGGLVLPNVVQAQPGHDGRDASARGGLIALADANKDGKVSKAELTAALDARFTKMDVNRDGKLTKEDRELRRQARLDDRFAALDSDRNGQISKAEFTAGHQDRAGRPGSDETAARAKGGRHGHHGFGKGGMFRAEAGQDGALTRAEFMARPLAMFDKADVNKDGMVTAEEMQAARQAMRDQWQARRAGDASKK